MFSSKFRSGCYPALLVAFFVSTVTAKADVVCARLFTDHMVLQQGRSVPVWGKADPGERVTVEFANQRREATATADGSWEVELGPLPASFEPRRLTVRGKNTVEFSDVLVGEVWFCSGQSNMEKPVGEISKQRPSAGHDLDLLTARQPALRLFQIPRTDLKQEGPGVFRWLPVTPETLKAARFSAAGYHFGRVLQAALEVPVGIIHASFGGSRIEAWMPPEAFAQPPLAGLEKVKYQAWVRGVQPTELFASMVRSYAPYGIRGFLWYQGETNCGGGEVALYAEKQTALVEHWRKIWRAPEAPFYGTLLAPFVYSTWNGMQSGADALPAFWQEQIKALSAPNTGFIVINDLVDDFRDIHPVEKRGVGERFARLALAETYGISGLIARSPQVSATSFNGNTVEVSFTHTTKLRTRDRLAPDCFEIAGEDRVFRRAHAELEGARVRLSHPEVNAPKAVRLGWSETSRPNLINEAGLPATPFRSDDWPLQLQRPAAAATPQGNRRDNTATP